MRQRRNLMAISLVLLVADIPNALPINNSLTLHVHAPFTVGMVLWIIWGYWLWRYYTSFRELGDKGFLNLHGSRRRRLITKIALRQLTHDPALKQRLEKELEAIKAVGWRYSNSYGTATPNAEALGLMANTDPKQPKWQEMNWRPEVTVEGLSQKMTYYRAWIYVLFHTSLFSEYVIPFLLALVTLLFGIYRWASLYAQN